MTRLRPNDLHRFFGHKIKKFSNSKAVFEFIETYYNRKRPHSTIGYRIPAQAMEDFFKRTAPMQTAMQKAA